MVTGLIVTGVQEKIFALQRGRSTVIDANHTVILGWSEHSVYTEPKDWHKFQG